MFFSYGRTGRLAGGRDGCLEKKRERTKEKREEKRKKEQNVVQTIGEIHKRSTFCTSDPSLDSLSAHPRYSHRCPFFTMKVLNLKKNLHTFLIFGGFGESQRFLIFTEIRIPCYAARGICGARQDWSGIGVVVQARQQFPQFPQFPAAPVC